ncbi:MAG: cyanophycinase [Simplicispira sp.]|nr:cyanophycinase [Simplicispira sp.]
MTPYRLATLALACALVAACGGGSDTPSAPASYEYFAVGQPKAAVQTFAPTEPSVAIMGGGPDVDSAFRWMIERSGIRPGTGGRFVIIRASGSDGYNPYIYYGSEHNATTGAPAADWVGGAALGLSAVETLVIPDRAAANHPFVNAVVAGAQAVFIAGGDQSDYINYWKGTALDTTLNQLMQKNVPIGGTSAGLAVLGQFDFAALRDTVTTEEALANPYNEFMTLDPDPLGLTGGFLVPGAFKNTILDSHLDTRDRMGRFMTFVSRLVAPSGTTGCPGGILSAGISARDGARGIGLGVEAALLVQGDGKHTPYTGRRATNPSTTTESAVYFVRPLQAPTLCSPGKPLTVQGMEVRKLTDNTPFNLSDWSGAPAYTIDINAGVLSSNPY